MQRLLKLAVAASIVTAALCLLYAIGMLVPVVKDLLLFFTSMALILLAIAGLHVGEANEGFIVPTANSYLLLACALWLLSFVPAAIFMPRHRPDSEVES